MGGTQVLGKAGAVGFAAENHVDVVVVAGQPLAHELAVGMVVGGIGRHPVGGGEGDDAQEGRAQVRALGKLIAAVQLA